MKASVCVLAYNHEKYIRKTLESILKQKTDFDFNIIIGEDHSTDNTREICLEYKNKFPDRIHLILRDRNVGAINNAIESIKSCNGKYIIYLEGDDYWIDEYKIQKQINFLENNGDYGLVYTNYFYNLPNSDKHFVMYKKIMPSGYVLNNIISGSFPRVLTVCYRKDLLEEDFFDLISDENITFLDYITYMYLARKTKFKYLQDITSQYNYNNNSITKKSHYKDRLKFFESALYALDKFIRVYNIRDMSFLKSAEIVKRSRLNIIFYYYIKLKDIKGALNTISMIKNINNTLGFKYKIYQYILIKTGNTNMISMLRNMTITLKHLKQIFKSLIIFNIDESINNFKSFISDFHKYKERRKTTFSK